MSSPRHLRRRPSGLRRLAAASTAAGAVAAPVALAPAAGAQELTADSIIAELEELSRQAEANSEEVTALDGQVAEQEKIVGTLQNDLARAHAHAERVRDEADAIRADLAAHARERMRGTSVDPLTAMLGADDTQSAIDRAVYVTAFAREADALLDEAQHTQRAAADAHARAAAADAQARIQLGQLQHHRTELEARAGELDARTEEVRARVDSLSPEQLAIWRQKNNPLADGIAAFAGAAGVVDAALSKVGSPYSWGAAGPDAFDCSGLMYWAYQQMGKTIPRTSQAQLAGGTPVSRDQLQPGDLIGYYPGVTHVGMYVGGGMIVHASDYGIPVQVVPIDQGGPYQGAVRY
ncbi:NlpC/P60 family protein [Corynebacterium sp. 335C]